MSTPSIHGSVYNCAWGKITGENAERMQSQRFFDPSLNVASNIYRTSNEGHAGRPASANSDNGVSGLAGLGFAGLNPADFIGLESNLRQVEWRSGSTNFYDTMTGANRANWPNQFAGTSGSACGVSGGPDAYSNTPSRNTSGQPTSVDRQRYLAALHQVYQGQRRY